MKGGLFVKLMLVLIFLALVANLAVSAITGESMVGASLAMFLAFGALVLANLLMAGAGIWFTSKSHRKREKSSVKWGRRGFLANGVVTTLFGLAPFFFYPNPEGGSAVPLSTKALDLSLVLLAFGVSNATFLYAYYREYRRTVGGDRDGKRARRRSARSAPAGKSALPDA